VLDASAARILLLLVWPKPSALLTTTWLASTLLLLLAKILAAGALLALSLPIVMLLLVHETARVLESSHPIIMYTERTSLDRAQRSAAEHMPLKTRILLDELATHIAAVLPDSRQRHPRRTRARS
jgi:hypothetical protein